MKFHIRNKRQKQNKEQLYNLYRDSHILTFCPICFIICAHNWWLLLILLALPLHTHTRITVRTRMLEGKCVNVQGIRPCTPPFLGAYVLRIRIFAMSIVQLSAS